MPNEPLKRCSRCGETKPHSAFSRMNGTHDHKPGLQGYCKECSNAHRRERLARMRLVAASRPAPQPFIRQT